MRRVQILFCCEGLLGAALVGWIMASPPVQGRPVSDAEAASVIGGTCMTISTTTSCGNDNSCDTIASGYYVSNTTGTETIDQRKSCTTSSCGTYGTSKKSCSNSG